MNNTTTTLHPRSAGSFAVGLCIFLASSAVMAQSLAVLPVNIQMAPKQMATTLTVINQGAAETSVQIRAFAWKQVNGTEQLTPSDDVQGQPPYRYDCAGRHASHSSCTSAGPPGQ